MSRRPTDLRYVKGDGGFGRVASWEAIRRHVLDEEPDCRICGAPAAEVDHIWPLRYGGDDRRGNLQALCVPCNRAKGDRAPEWTAATLDLRCAVYTVVARITDELDDLDRFVAPLTERVEGQDPAYDGTLPAFTVLVQARGLVRQLVLRLNAVASEASAVVDAEELRRSERAEFDALIGLVAP